MSKYLYMISCVCIVWWAYDIISYMLINDCDYLLLGFQFSIDAIEYYIIIIYRWHTLSFSTKWFYFSSTIINIFII